ncbi:MAG: protein kinase domain-containing protein [Planctomycetota bacterium]
MTEGLPTRHPDLGDARIERGMAVAFGPYETREVESVLATIEQVAGAARVLLREPDEGLPQLRRARPAEAPRDESRYRVVGEIGRGRVEVVFEGRDLNLGRRVALRVLHPDRAADHGSVRRFLEGAQLVGQLDHPAVVPVYGVGIASDDRPYIATKLVQGETLAESLERRKDPNHDLPRLLRIFEQVSKAVAYAHARGVVHTDLSPAHVLLGSFGEVHVTDWGSARILPRREPTPSGPVASAPPCAPREQAAGAAGELDERCDVFALGAILCELLTGGAPYAGTPAEPQAQAKDARLEAALERLDASRADASLVSLAKRCLAARPEDRPRDAGAVAEGISEYLAAAEERVRTNEVQAAAHRARARHAREQERFARRKAEWARRARRRTLAIAAMVLIAVGAGGSAYLRADLAERTRGARTLSSVLEAMRLAAGHEQAAEWERATAWARKAVASATAGAADPETRGEAGALLERIEQGAQAAREATRMRTADSAMAERLERIRMQSAFDLGLRRDQIHESYAAAFQEFGIDVERLDAPEAARELGKRTIPEKLAAALDEWAWRVAPAREGEDLPWGPRFWAKLLEIAQGVDPDGWRNRFRRGRLAASPPDLLALADAADFSVLPPGTAVLLARQLEREGERHRALEVLRAAHRHHADDYWVNALLARRLWDDEKTEEAVGFQRAALALRPDERWVWSDLCGMLLNLDRFEESIACGRRAVELRPEDMIPRNQLGLALKFGGHRDEALAQFTRATELDPDHATPYFNLGIMHLENRQPGKAVPRFRQTVDADPKHDRAWRHLALALWMAGDHEGAIPPLRRALEMTPNAPGRLGFLAWLLLTRETPREGDAPEALELAEKAVSLASHNMQYWMALGAARYRTGRYGEAIQALDHALAGGAPGVAGFFLAMSHHRLGHSAQARDCFAKAAAWRKARAPNDAEVNRIHAEAAALLGEDAR